MSLRRAVLLGLLALPALARAQTIRGAVVDRGENAPVSGVVVLLVDARGNIAARALSNDAGEFRLTAGTAGAYRVRTLRIGFRPVISEPVYLNAGQELTQQIELAGVPFSLDTVRVVGRNVCRLNTDSATATYAIWEQVRTALTAAQLTSRTRAYGATLVTYDRALDPNGRRIRRQASVIKSGFTVRPWYSLSADSLRRVGYVVPQADSSRIYYAPDLDVLISNTFLDDHCFRIANSSDPARLGIAFEPSADRWRIPEIRGTVWLDRKSSELRDMEFRYTNVSRLQEDARAGGEMEFIRMRNNTWAISRWSIRMPLLAQVPGEPSGVPGMPTQPRVRVSELQITGGELALVTRGRDTLWSRPPLTLAGTVVDSVSERPIVGARVSLRGSALQGTSDAAGRFSISGVLPGEYTMQVRTTALDSLAAVWQSTLTFTEASRPFSAPLPSTSAVVNRLCPDTSMQPAGLVVGEVRVGADTAARRNVRVLAVWTEFSVSTAGLVVARETPRVLEARTDVTGTYRICGVPLNTRFAVRSDILDTGAIFSRIPSTARFVRVDVVVGHQATPVAMQVSAGTAVFMGTVLSESKRQPISDAEVSLPDLGLSTRTNALGEFRLSEIPAGNHLVAVRQIGYAPMSVRLDLSDNSTTARPFFLTAAQVLDSVVVAARRPNLPEFEERRKLRIGHFITRDELEKQENRRMSEVLARVGGLRVERARGGNQAWISAGRGQLTRYTPDSHSAAMGAQPNCYVDVWMDGVRVYAGQEQQLLFDVNSLMPGMLEGVEYYVGAGTIPAKYSRVNQDCGVLVLWTRRGE